MTDQRDESIGDALAKLEGTPAMQVKTGRMQLWLRFKRTYPNTIGHSETWARLIQLEIANYDQGNEKSASDIIMEVASYTAIEAGPSSVNTRFFVVLSAMILVVCWSLGDDLLKWLNNSRYSNTTGTPSLWIFPPDSPCDSISPEGEVRIKRRPCR
jgi:hypothetical protein